MPPIEEKTDIGCIAASSLIAASAVFLLAACGGGSGMASPAPSQAASGGPTVMRTALKAAAEADPNEVASDQEGNDGRFQTVPRAHCGEGDHPETGLQGQVPAALRASGFQGFNCNLELVGQSRGDGASWQHAWFQDSAEHRCAYYDTSSATTGRSHLGTVVLDVSHAINPTPTAYLTSVSMLDPWESLRTNARRQILAAESAKNGRGGPEFDVYDLTLDCRYPQLLSSIAMGTASNGDAAALPSGDTLQGHEGAFAPDGLTYYGGDRGKPTKYTAIDVADTTHPKLITVYTLDPGVLAHGLSVSDDGNRAYVALDTDPGVAANFANLPATNGVLILDTSETQARMPNPQFKAIGKIVLRVFGEPGQQKRLLKRVRCMLQHRSRIARLSGRTRQWPDSRLLARLPHVGSSGLMEVKTRPHRSP
jgi:hypothetical protein